MFLQNKYKKWHDLIIEKALKRKTVEGYKETHHILPKSLGGTNDENNLVQLTAREHFIIHLLLTYCLEGQNKHKMLCAFIFMLGKNKKFKNSRLYEKIRKEMALFKTNRKLSKETKLKISKARTGIKLSKKTKDLIKYKRQFQICSEEQRKRYSEIYSNLIWINKNGISKRVRSELKNKYLKQGFELGRDISYLTPEIRNKLSKATTEYWKRKVS